MAINPKYIVLEKGLPARERIKTETVRFELAKGEDFPHNGEAFFQGGKIGKHIGVSRQRLNQILKEPKEMPTGWYTSENTMKIMGISEQSLRKASKSHRIKWVKIGRTNWYKLDSYKPNLCKEHGNPVAKGRQVHCSAQCAAEADYASMKRGSWRRLKKKQGLASK